MKTWMTLTGLASVTWLATAGVSFAGTVTVPMGAPAPLLGAGLPGLAVLAVTGAGYLAVRMRRRNRD